uniref:Putative sigma-70 region domain containing protein n=1 Tax=viral metagenome TaxID=1070528 RepID=A0A6M3JJD5_9ZZZZ
MANDYNKYHREKNTVKKWWVARTESERITMIFRIVKILPDRVAAEIVERHHMSTKAYPDGQSLKKIARYMKIPFSTVKDKYHRAIERIKIIARNREQRGVK